MTTVVETHPCIDCQAPVERELPAEGKFGRDVLLGVLRCDDCADSLERRETAAAADRERRDSEDKLRRRLEASGLPSGLRDLAPLVSPTESQGPAIDAARDWVDGGGGLVLTGPVGVGKTHIAAVACRAALAVRACQWVSAPLLFARLGSGLGSEQRDQALNVLTSRTALVLDDLDKARPTEYGAEHVFLAVDGRVTNNSPLLVTTNLSLGELAAKFPEPYGEAVASRLAGYCRVVRLAGHDQRTRP